MLGLVRRALRDEAGATAIEYALIASLLSIVIISTIHGMSANLLSIFTSVNSGLAH